MSSADSPIPAEDVAADCPRAATWELLRIAVPLILSAGSVSLMNVVDRMFLTWLSSDALAASLPAGMLHWTVLSLAIGIAMYVNTFVAQYEGAGRPDRVAAAVWQGIYFSAIAGVVMLGIVPFTEDVFRLVSHAREVRELEVDYFSVLCLDSTPFVVSAVFSSYFSGRGKSLTVMTVNLFAVAVNAGLDYLLIFGVGPFPEMGVAGAALATLIAKSVEVLVYAALMFGPSADPRYPLRTAWRFDRELFARMLRYGLPNGMQFLADVAAFAVFIFILGTIGPTELAATNLAFNLNSLAFIPMMGMGTAVMTIVGQRIGEGRPERAVRTTWTAFGLSAAYMGAWIVVYLFLPDVVMLPYALKSDPEEFAAMRATVIVLLRFVAIYSFFDAMAIVFGAAIRGAGDTRFSMLFSFFGAWFLMVLPTAVIAWKWGGDLWLSWGACSVYVVVAGLGFLWRFQTGKWKRYRVIEPTGSSAESVDDDAPVAAATTDDVDSAPFDVAAERPDSRCTTAG